MSFYPTFECLDCGNTKTIPSLAYQYPIGAVARGPVCEDCYKKHEALLDESRTPGMVTYPNGATLPYNATAKQIHDAGTTSTVIIIEIDNDMDTSAYIEGGDNPTTEQTDALLELTTLAFHHRQTLTGRPDSPRRLRRTPTGYDAVRA